MPALESFRSILFSFSVSFEFSAMFHTPGKDYSTGFLKTPAWWGLNLYGPLRPFL
jgi:hypothetical protein